MTVYFLKKLLTSLQMSQGNSQGSCILQMKIYHLHLCAADTATCFWLGGEATALHLPQLRKQTAEPDGKT